AVPMPPIAIAPELTIDPPARRAPTIALPTGPAVKQPEPQAPVAPPRFDLAYLDNPAPEYPPLSRRLREQGRVMLRVLVSAQGSAQDVEIGTSSGSERLDRAAVEAVRRWRFEPARRGSQAVAAWALVPVLFQLDT
ncbi:MAG TPA: energy transducer TonB, partial [Usitatibacter sp.]|nr:energy transducer TonB [Usitatibacter sp.]